MNSSPHGFRALVRRILVIVWMFLNSDFTREMLLNE
nr:MAG TPA: hypothetical protein [Microviridae sp.]